MNKLFIWRLCGFFFAGLLFFIPACKESAPKETEEKLTIRERITPSFAEGFEILKTDSLKIIRTSLVFDKDTVRTDYVLRTKGSPVPESDFLQNPVHLEQPIERTVLFSTALAAFFREISVEEKIIGFGGGTYLYDSLLLSRIKSGAVKEVAPESIEQLNTELLLTLEADMLMSYAAQTGQSQFEKLRSMGQKVVLSGEYLEASPLAQAEWILFTAAFFDKEKEAQGFFKEVTSSYREISEKCKQASVQPSVFANLPYDDVWYMPGGKSFPAIYFRDAGMNYLWKDTEKKGTLPLDFEAVLQKAKKADFWFLNTSFIRRNADLADQDERFKSFVAFGKGRVLNTTARVRDRYGNDFFETGVTRPDLVLKDLAQIAHPEIFTDNELFFTEILK